jgi:putative ABC transport system permease protein
MTTRFFLDLKLALRMLVKYPLLTIVGSLGIAFGIAAGVGGFELRSRFLNPTLPLAEGDRIVGLRNWDTRADRPGPLGNADFSTWLEQLQRIDDLGAAVMTEQNLTIDGTVEPISVAEITASGFRVARVPPLLGRTLVEGDEAEGALPVVVIGHSLWQRRFLGDPGVVGRTVRLGIDQATIVGVMPEGFGFPVAHQVWTPLKAGRSERPGPTLERTGPATDTLLVFGRLAPGVTLNEAQAELTTIGRRSAADSPETHTFLRPEVIPYAHLIVDPGNFDVALGLTLANIFLITVVLLVSANVALLMFARAASREREIAVRYALGAGRRRIVTQLFAEGLALSGVSVILGLIVVRAALGSLLRMIEADSGRALPFWVNDSLTPSTVAYGIGLSILVAVIIGVFPALRITKGGLDSRLRSFSAGGGGYRFGGVWTAAIVAQVAVTVVFPAAAFFFHRWVVASQIRDVGFAANEYLSARLAMDSGTRERTAAIIEELRRRLSAEPGVTSVTIADRLPGMLHAGARFEVEGDEAPTTYGYDVRMASVDAEFFSALHAPVLAGRDFAPSDLASGREARGRAVAIVNASFVSRVLRGRSPVGRRVRLVGRDTEHPPGPWIEIIGLVRDLGVGGTNGVGLYRPLPVDAATLHVAVHMSGAPEAFGNRLRMVANRVEPTLRVYDLMPLDRVGADQALESQYLSRVLAVLSGVALLLSLMAIYAVMAFTVVQRTREIGTRVALGANRWRVIAAIARRPLGQIGLGIVVGGTLVPLMSGTLFESTPTPFESILMVAYATLMLAVCLSACVVPIRRALGLEPSQVLRAEA